MVTFIADIILLFLFLLLRLSDDFFGFSYVFDRIHFSLLLLLLLQVIIPPSQHSRPRESPTWGHNIALHSWYQVLTTSSY